MSDIAKRRDLHRCLGWKEKYFQWDRRIFAMENDDPENPFRVQNWANRERYTMSDLPSDHWRWEFIRRSSAYRSYWRAAHEPGSDLKLECRIKTRSGVEDRFGLLNLLDPSLAADEIESVLHFKPAQYIGPWDDHYSFSIRGRGEFHLDEVIENTRLANCYTPSMEDFFGPYTIVATFETTKPLKPQFEEIRKYVETHPHKPLSKPPLTRVRSLNYALYLRLLDARDKTSPYYASFKTIADTLSPERGAGYTTDQVEELYGQAADTQIKILREASE